MSLHNRSYFIQLTSHLRYAIATVILGAMTGCNPDPNADFQVYRVKGKIVWKDSRPLPGKLGIVLQSMGSVNVQAVGNVQPDGTFSNLVFMGYGGDGRSGTIAGKHRVILQLRNPIGEEAVAMTPKQREEIAAQVRSFAPYSTFQKSKLEVEVGPNSEEFLIELDSTTTGGKGK